MGFACLFLLPFVWKKRGDVNKLSRQDWLFLALAGVCLGLHFALWFGSLKLTTVASSTIILALQPLIALAGAYFLYKEKTTFATLFTIGLAIFGVVLIGWGDVGISKAALLGDLLSFLSVIAVVGYLLIGQQKVKGISHWVYSFIVFLFAGIALLGYNLVLGVPLTGYPSQEWGIFLLLAIFPTIAHVIYNHLLNHINTTTISMSILGEPVGATLLAVLLLGETLVPMQLIGGTFILAGVFLYLFQFRKPAVE